MTAEARQLVAAAANLYGDLDITAVERPYRQVDRRDKGNTRRAASLASGSAH